MLVWRKSCTFSFPKTSRATPATAGQSQRRVKILSRLVATLADFLRKSKLVSVLCGSHKNFNSHKERVKKNFNAQRHMSLPRPNESYHFQANLIWWDSPFKCRLSIRLFVCFSALCSDYVMWVRPPYWYNLHKLKVPLRPPHFLSFYTKRLAE